jgi:hypothetical protein
VVSWRLRLVGIVFFADQAGRISYKDSAIAFEQFFDFQAFWRDPNLASMMLRRSWRYLA